MPPKFDANAPEAVALIALFTTLGLTPQKALDTAKLPKLAASLQSIIQESSIDPASTPEWSPLIAPLLIHLAGVKTGSWEQANHGAGRKFLTAFILDLKLKSVDQING